jgi:hypothetical protein
MTMIGNIPLESSNPEIKSIRVQTYLSAFEKMLGNLLKPGMMWMFASKYRGRRPGESMNIRRPYHRVDIALI